MRQNTMPRRWTLRLFAAAGGLAASTLIFAGSADPAFTCPMSAIVASQPAAATIAEDKTCLIAPKDIGNRRVYDLRSRAEYVEFHVPGAENATFGSLLSMPGAEDRRIAVYDGGRVRSDAFQLCQRLRSAGFKQVKVVDGGIAAWAQKQDRERALTLNRLSDADVAGALADASNEVVVLTEAMRPALRQYEIRRAAGAKPARAVILADAQTPVAAIQAHLAKSRTAFYWVGTPERLQKALGTQLAQERKREAGPAEPSVCGAL